MDLAAPEIVARIEDVFQRYWGGHYEAVKTFFGLPRPRDQLIAWLELQLYLSGWLRLKPAR